MFQNFQNIFKKFGQEFILVVLQLEDCNPATSLLKRRFLKISSSATVGNILMNMIEFSMQLQNAVTVPFTVLKSDSTTVTPPVILRILETHETFGDGVSFQYSYILGKHWTAQIA